MNKFDRRFLEKGGRFLLLFSGKSYQRVSKRCLLKSLDQQYYANTQESNRIKFGQEVVGLSRRVPAVAGSYLPSFHPEPARELIKVSRQRLVPTPMYNNTFVKTIEERQVRSLSAKSVPKRPRLEFH